MRYWRFTSLGSVNGSTGDYNFLFHSSVANLRFVSDGLILGSIWFGSIFGVFLLCQQIFGHFYKCKWVDCWKCVMLFSLVCFKWTLERDSVDSVTFSLFINTTPWDKTIKQIYTTNMAEYGWWQAKQLACWKLNDSAWTFVREPIKCLHILVCTLYTTFPTQWGHEARRNVYLL